MTDAPWVAGQKRRLRGTLRRWRKENGLSQQEAAAAMGWSLSKMARLENGTGRARPSDILALLTHYGAPPDTAAELAGVVRGMAGRDIEHLSQGDLFPPPFRSFLEFELAAESVHHWQPLVIPGILQTAEYARETYRTITRLDSEPRIGRFVHARMERQRLLLRTGGPRFHFLIDEGVLLRSIGSTALMRTQLDHLCHMAGSENVTIQLMPFAAGTHPGLRGPFILLHFGTDEDDDVLYFENARGDFLARDEKKETKNYCILFRELTGMALTRAETLDRILEISDLLAS